MLASYPDSLRLWSAHAYLQRIRRKVDAARKVYETCLIHNTSTMLWTDAKSTERASMWWSWAEMEWLEERSTAAVRVLCAAVGVTMPEDVSDTRLHLLRARKAYDVVLKTGGVSGSTKVELLQCLALLELIHTNNIPGTLAVFSNYDSILASSRDHPAEARILEERLAIASALLIYRHAHVLKNSNRPIDLRNHIDALIRKFPGNTLLLGVWLESERGEAVWGRVRTGVAAVVLGGGDSMGTLRPTIMTVSAARWAWAVWVETWERGTWDAGRARRVIRRALEDPRYVVHWRFGLQLVVFSIPAE